MCLPDLHCTGILVGVDGTLGMPDLHCTGILVGVDDSAAKRLVLSLQPARHHLDDEQFITKIALHPIIIHGTFAATGSLKILTFNE